MIEVNSVRGLPRKNAYYRGYIYIHITTVSDDYDDEDTIPESYGNLLQLFVRKVDRSNIGQFCRH
jgi:hypothetical protein